MSDRTLLAKSSFTVRPDHSTLARRNLSLCEQLDVSHDARARLEQQLAQLERHVSAPTLSLKRQLTQADQLIDQYRKEMRQMVRERATLETHLTEMQQQTASLVEEVERALAQGAPSPVRHEEVILFGA